MGHTVKVIFTDQRETMQTVNAIMLKEEMEKQKATKLSMSRQEKVNYVIIGRRIMTPSYVTPLDLTTVLNSSF
jgi:hypothetical protein